MAKPNITIAEPVKKPKGRGTAVHAELPTEIALAFKAECGRRGLEIKPVLLYLIAEWLAEKNPAEAKRVGVAK